MTPVSIRILAFAAFASLPVLAQQPASPNPQPPTGSSPQATSPQQTNPEPGATQNGQASPAPNTANSPEGANPSMRPVTGELQDKLDTKTAKSGDSVVVKTTEAATTATGVEIPKGSKIMGHIIDVAPVGQGGENSRVTLQFDQAEIKDGQTLTIRSVIQSVGPAGTTAGPDAAGGPSAATSSSGSTATGGGAGMTGSHPSGTSNPSATPNQSNPQAGAADSGQAGTPPAPGTVVATKGNIAVRTTSIPGVLLIGSVSGAPFSNAAGALLGARQEVHLDNGTVMVVAIAAVPHPVNGR